MDCVSLNDESLLTFVKYDKTNMYKNICGGTYCANYKYSVVHNGFVNYYNLKIF